MSIASDIAWKFSSLGCNHHHWFQRLSASLISLLPVAAAKRMTFRTLCLLSRIWGRIVGRKLVVFYVQRIFARKAEALADLLRSKGFQVEVRSGLSRRSRIQLQSRPDLWIGLWNSVPLEHLPRDYIFWNAEPIHMKRWNAEADWSDLNDGLDSVRFHESRHLRDAWVEAMSRAQSVWGYTENNAVFIARLAVPFTFVPFGYAPYYEAAFLKSIEGKAIPQDIDVLFVGWVTDRRKLLLDRLTERGMTVHIVSQNRITVEDELDQLLARSKIVLGIHCYDDLDAQIADFARFDYLLSNRIFAVHERPSAVARHPEFERHVITCDYADIPDTCAHYLAQPELRLTKAEKSYQWFKSEYALESFIPFDEVRGLLDQTGRC